MSLYNLKREYEERRRQLVEQLQKNPSLDPATQHQIYGAIKEIENFMRTIEYQISAEQEKSMNIELSRERPSPVMERTKGAIYHVAHGTKKVFTHHIPNATKTAVSKVTAVPKQYFDKRREEQRLRAEIEAEVRRRRVEQQLAANPEHVVLEHPHQELPQKAEPAHSEPVHPGPLPTWNDETVHRTEEVKPDEPKRPHAIAKPAKAKTHPAKKAKQGHQKKPRLKDERYKKAHIKGRR